MILEKYGIPNTINIITVFECDIIRDDANNYLNPYSILLRDLYNIASSDDEIKFVKESINAHIGQMLKPEPSKFNIFSDPFLLNDFKR